MDSKQPVKRQTAVKPYLMEEKTKTGREFG